MLTWTSFSPRATRSTISILAALSGLGLRAYSASNMFWSSGLSVLDVSNVDFDNDDRLLPSAPTLLTGQRWIVYIWREITIQGILRMDQESIARWRDLLIAQRHVFPGQYWTGFNSCFCGSHQRLSQMTMRWLKVIYKSCAARMKNEEKCTQYLYFERNGATRLR